MRRHRCRVVGKRVDTGRWGEAYICRMGLPNERFSCEGQGKARWDCSGALCKRLAGVAGLSDHAAVRWKIMLTLDLQVQHLFQADDDIRNQIERYHKRVFWAKICF